MGWDAPWLIGAGFFFFCATHLDQSSPSPNSACMQTCSKADKGTRRRCHGVSTVHSRGRWLSRSCSLSPLSGGGPRDGKSQENKEGPGPRKPPVDAHARVLHIQYSTRGEKQGPVSVDIHPALNVAVLRRIRNRTCSTCSVVTEWNTGRGAKKGPFLYLSPLQSRLHRYIGALYPSKPHQHVRSIRGSRSQRYPRCCAVLGIPRRRKWASIRRLRPRDKPRPNVRFEGATFPPAAVIPTNMETETAKRRSALETAQRRLRRRLDCAQLVTADA
ncbi:hypothetical protein LY76DRAFT_127979 [Colletotrichum caudatum]|nr:hypothetical protein LY76DRAFT_127979 [Colletotrichum caudatum]